MDNSKKIEEIFEVRFDLCRSDKEVDFVEDMSKRVANGYDLTPAQQVWVDDLYERACDSPL